MSKIDMDDIRKFISDNIEWFSVIGFLYEGKIYHIKNKKHSFTPPCSRNINQDIFNICNSCFSDNSLESTNNGYYDCKFGCSMYYCSISEITRQPALLFFYTSYDNDKKSIEAIDSILSKLPRKQKKSVKHLIEKEEAWKFSFSEETISRFLKIKYDLMALFSTKQDTAIQKTLYDHSNFVGSFSHEILSPLQEVKTFLERSLIRLQTVDKISYELVSSASFAIEKMRTSVEGMRLLFSGDSNISRNRFRVIDVKRVILNWCKIYENLIRSKNLIIICEPESISWDLNVIPEYFEILVKNIINNAIKYSFDASLYETPGKILIRFDKTRNRKNIYFVNFGIHINEEEISSGSLFKLAQRGINAEDRGRSGKGMGLYLVRLVADIHNAGIQVSSVVQNKGGRQEFSRNEFAFNFNNDDSRY